MSYLKKVLMILHEILFNAYNDFIDFCQDDELYNSMPYSYESILLSYEERYFGAMDIDEYEELPLKEGTDELEVIKNLAYDLYTASWLMKYNQDKLVSIFYSYYEGVYNTAAFFAMSHNLDELEEYIEDYERNGCDNFALLDTSSIIYNEYTFRGMSMNMTYSYNYFLVALEEIRNKYENLPTQEVSDEEWALLNKNKSDITKEELKALKFEELL